MKFEDYSPRFEGDLFAEGRRLLGDQLRTYSYFQEAIGQYPASHTREEHLQAIREFYRIATRTGVNGLNRRADPHAPWVAEEINRKIEGRRIVDAGCSEGLFTVFYALNHPDAEFIGIDLSEHALEAAKKKAAEHAVTNITWLCGDVLDASMAVALEGSDSVIFQDVLYQLFGSLDEQPAAEILRFLHPHQRSGSIAILAQEGNNLEQGYLGIYDAGYVLDSRTGNRFFDTNTGNEIECDVAVFRRQ